MAEISLGHVDIVFGYEVSRLARNNRDWYLLFDLAAMFGTLIADRVSSLARWHGCQRPCRTPSRTRNGASDQWHLYWMGKVDAWWPYSSPERGRKYTLPARLQHLAEDKRGCFWGRCYRLVVSEFGRKSMENLSHQFS